MVQLGYFTIDTPDVGKARAFYSALFGWSFNEAESGPTYAHVAGSDPAFGFTKVERAKAFPHLYFRVDDVEASCTRVTELAEQAWQAVLVRYAYAGIFAVRNERLSLIPKKCLPRMRELACDHYFGPYMYERLWLHLFGLPFVSENAVSAIEKEMSGEEPVFR